MPASRRPGTGRPGPNSTGARARSADGAVGIWHETYVVDRAESIYVGTPAMGLAKATEAVPIGRRGDRAAQRLGTGSSRPAVA
jgi:hypothetical protein